MKKDLKRSSTVALAVVIGIMAVSDPAHAGLFGIFGKKKKKKDNEEQTTAQATAPTPYPTPYPTATPYPTPYPTAYPTSYGNTTGYGYSGSSYGSGYNSGTTSTYGTSSISYDSYSGRVDYGQFDMYTDYLRFASPAYGYRPMAINGPAYDPNPSTAPSSPQVQQILTAKLNTHSTDIGGATVQSSIVRNIYRLRNNNPAFVTDNGLTQQGLNAKTLFTQTVISMGLDPRDYWSSEMDQRLGATDPRTLADLDLLLMNSYIALAKHLNTGRSQPQLIDTATLYKKREFTDYVALNNTLRPGANMVEGLQSLAPQHPQYKQLEQALAKFRQIQANGGWPALMGMTPLKLGVNNSDVPKFRQRLVDLGLLPEYERSNTSTIYDMNLKQAAIKFQKNHKLGSDGVIGTQGFKVLNIPIATRINQIRTTMDKWRLLPRTLGDRYIFVNTARQELEVIEYGVKVLEMDTINGKRLKPTPDMVDSMNSVVLNPYWNPPENNIREIVKTQKENPKHLAEHNIKLYDKNGNVVDPRTVNWNLYKNTVPPYRFREEPGPMNSLGVVKFNLAVNTQAIYLHDTNVNHDPSLRGLFERDDRFISSGCIRVKNPLALLQYVLRDQPNYDAYGLDGILSYPEQYPAQTVKLTKAIPVYIVYGSVSFTDDGAIQLTNDEKDYGKDARMLTAMTPGKSER